MRRIRTLGLGVVVALALMAIPTGASASGGIESEVDPTSLWGETIGAEAQLTFGPGGPGTDCDGMLEDEIGKRASTISGVSELACGLAVNMNGCRFEFKPGSENSFGIGPSGCGPIKTTVQMGCKYSIGAQAGFPATYTNTGAGANAAVIIKSSTTELTYTSESSGACGGIGKIYKNGSFTSEWEVQGFDLNGESTGIHATDEFTQGFFLIGEESSEEGSKPKFSAETYPASIVGSQPLGEELRFETTEGSTPITCASGGFSAELTVGAGTLPVDALYTDCLASYVSSVAVDMNSCHYTFSLANVGPPYSGGLELECANESDSIELWWKIPFAEDCTILLPAQSPASSVAYTNEGTGSDRTVHAVFKTSGLKYSITGNKLCSGNLKGGGTLSGEAMLHGTLG